MSKSVLLIIVWIACGILHYGVMLAYWQRGWPSLARQQARQDMWKSMVWSLGGPISLIAALVTVWDKAGPGFQGLLWHPLHAQEHQEE